MIPNYVTTHAPELAKKKEKLPPSPNAVAPRILTPAELGINFTVAVGRWAFAGFPTVSEETYKIRQAICNACPFWDQSGWMGMGKCTKCRCSGKKLWLATEKCPDKLW